MVQYGEVACEKYWLQNCKMLKQAPTKEQVLSEVGNCLLLGFILDNQKDFYRNNSYRNSVYLKISLSSI